MKKYIPYISVILSMLIWSASGIAIKETLLSMSPLLMILLRFTLAVVLMLCTGLIANRCSAHGILTLTKPDKKDWPLFLLGGFFQPFLYYMLETYTYKSLSSPTIAEAMLSIAPLIAPIFAFILLREHVTRNNILGILVSTGGMLLLVLAGAENFNIGNPWGILLAVLSVSTAVMYTIVLRKIPAHYSSLSIVFYVQLSGLVMFYLLGVIADRSVFTELFAVNWSECMPAVWGVLYLSVFSSVVAFVLFCYTVREIGVTRTNAFNNIRPVFTALLMLLAFGEHLPLWKWVGMALIIAGLFVCQKQSSKSGKR